MPVKPGPEMQHDAASNVGGRHEHEFFCSLAVVCCLATSPALVPRETVADEVGGLRAGWVTADITPERPVALRGQQFRRISEGVSDPLTCTALALESVGDAVSDQAVLVSCDLISIGPELVDAVTAELESRRERAPGLDPASGLSVPGGTRMYGATAAANFDSIEGAADTALAIVCFWKPGEGLARRIANAVSDVMPIVRTGLQAAPEFVHAVRTLDLPQRLVSPAERDRCQADAEASKTVERRNWHLKVVTRFDEQQATLERGGRPTVPIRVHALRLGDVAIVTNPFELFLDYGIRIQARSPATLTCIVQLAGRGTSGTYLPTFRAVEGGGYSAFIQSNVVGPEGGRMLVDESVRMLEGLWKPRDAARESR